MKVRKKPVIVDAWELTPQNAVWLLGKIPGSKNIGQTFDVGIFIPTLEGIHLARYGDYIIHGVNGEFYPCKPDIFEKTYDILEMAFPEKKELRSSLKEGVEVEYWRILGRTKIIRTKG